MKTTRKQAVKKHKFGVDLDVYKTKSKNVGVVHEKVKGGHFEEFYHKKSTFTYYILKGKGTFYLNRRKIEVGPTDVIVAPPMTKIYFLGNMELLLITTPAWQAKYEVHVRDIERKTS